MNKHKLKVRVYMIRSPASISVFGAPEMTTQKPLTSHLRETRGFVVFRPRRPNLRLIVSISPYRGVSLSLAENLGRGSGRIVVLAVGQAATCVQRDGVGAAGPSGHIHRITSLPPARVPPAPLEPQHPKEKRVIVWTPFFRTPACHSFSDHD